MRKNYYKYNYIIYIFKNEVLVFLYKKRLNEKLGESIVESEENVSNIL